MKRKILFSLIVLVITIIIGQVSYAAVEIVPSKNGKGTDQMVNTTISNSYLLCQNMKQAGESLNGSTVLPHLATNKDWGAVSYLSNSIYGTNTEGKNTGVEITIDDVKYYSTTGNITGVMNWGSNPNATRFTQTAGLIQSYNNDTSTASANIVEIYNNKDTSYVNASIATNTVGMAITETKGLYNSTYFVSNSNEYPVSIRNSLFGIAVGDRLWYTYRPAVTTGIANELTTFRPVIWN